MLRLALSNLVCRKGRSAITIVGVGVGIMLLLVIVGMTEGTIREVVDRMQNVDADLIACPRGFSLTTDRGAPLGEAYRGLLQAVDGVADAVPVANWWVVVGGQQQNTLGVHRADLPRIKGSHAYAAGGDFQGGNEMVIDQRLADAAGLKVGSVVDVWARPFTVVGICRTGIPTRVLMPIETIQQAAYNGSSVCTFFFIKCRSPKDIAAVTQRIAADETFGMQVIPVPDYGRLLTTGSLRILRQLVWAITGVGLLISFLVISLSMYTTILERTREVGILKALGAGRGFIVGSILAESVLLCLGGVVVGFGLAALGKLGVERVLPLMTVAITGRWLVNAAALGFAGGVLGALYPARRAARLDPVVSLSYE